MSSNSTTATTNTTTTSSSITLTNSTTQTSTSTSTNTSTTTNTDTATTNTSSSSSSSSPSSSSSSPSSSVLSTPLTSSILTTIVTTGPNGQTSTVVTTTATTVPAGTTVGPSHSSTSSSNHTGAIVGATVGGVAFLVLLAVFVAMCLRRERQKRLDKAFDGNFDPDHTSPTVGSSTYHDKGGRLAGGGTLPNVGVNVDNDDDGMGGRLAGAAIGAGVISPFVLGQRNHSPPHGPQQHHYDGGNRSAYTGSQYGGTTSESGTYTSPTSTGSYYPDHQPLPNPHDYPSALMPGVPRTGPLSATSASRSAKEREAMSARAPGGFAVANPGPEGSSGANNSTVLVHQDAGRVAEEDRDEGQSEIPPTYESIPRT